MGIATPTTTGAARQLSDGNSLGTLLGNSTTDKIGFFSNSSAAAIVQPSGGAYGAIARGQACGVIATIASTQSPSLVTSNTSRESSLTAMVSTTSSFLVAANDLIFVNKPTSQAGLGVGNARVSASNAVAVTFNNWTASTVTPTASEKYSIVAIRGLANTTQALTPASVPAASIVEQQFTVTGLKAGELVQVSKPTAQTGLDIVGCRVVSNNTLGITFGNMTAATAIVPTAAETYTIFSLGGLDAVNNNVLAEIFVAGGTKTTGAGAVNVSVTATGLLATDVVQGIQKPTIDTGIVINGLTSAANVLGITYGNVTAATVTAATNEVYGVSLARLAPAAPLVVYSAALTPTGVAANTTAEQTFTVAGLVANTPVWVNKPTWQNGLGVAGCRVSGTDSLCITYCNSTATTITPTAETYLIGNFKMPISDGGNTWIQAASPTQQANSVLANAIRTALVNLGLTASA